MKDPIIKITYTEKDILDFLNDAGLGDAIGECPINDNIALAIVREFAFDIEVEVRDYIDSIIGRLADRHARIERLPK